MANAARSSKKEGKKFIPKNNANSFSAKLYLIHPSGINPGSLDEMTYNAFIPCKLKIRNFSLLCGTSINQKLI